LTPVVVITVRHRYDFDRKSFSSSVVVFEMDCRTSYSIDVVKCTPVGLTLLAGYFLMEGRTRTNTEQDRVLAEGQSSGECQRLKSDIYFSFSFWHST